MRPKSPTEIISGATSDMWSQYKVPVPLPSGGWRSWNGWQKAGVIGLGGAFVLLVVGACVSAARS